MAEIFISNDGNLLFVPSGLSNGIFDFAIKLVSRRIAV